MYAAQICFALLYYVPGRSVAFICFPLPDVQSFSLSNLASTLRISRAYILLLALGNMKVLFANLLLAATCYAQPSADYRYVRANANTTELGGWNVTWTPEEVSQPDATRQVSFSQTPNNYAGGQNWTWTLAISEVAFADLSIDEPDSRVAFTTYTFEWPEGGDVNNTIFPTQPDTATTDKQCMYQIMANFAPNVSNAWDSGSASCASAIGIECEEYLLSQRWLGSSLAGDCDPPTGILGNGRPAECIDYMPRGGGVYGYRKSFIRRQ
jgi:hypothetical protein